MQPPNSTNIKLQPDRRQGDHWRRGSWNTDEQWTRGTNAVHLEIFNHCINWEESTVVEKEKRTKESIIKGNFHMDSGEAGVTTWTRGTPSAKCGNPDQRHVNIYIHPLSHWSFIGQWVTTGNSQWCLIFVLYVSEELWWVRPCSVWVCFHFEYI